jgi:hypothetical protein
MLYLNAKTKQNTYLFKVIIIFFAPLPPPPFFPTLETLETRVHFLGEIVVKYLTLPQFLSFGASRWLSEKSPIFFYQNQIFIAFLLPNNFSKT